MKPGLYIEPRGGLCNRMRVIDSALFLARDIRKPLHLVWTIDNAVGCPFEDLFVVPDQIASIKTVSRWQIGYEKMQEELARLRNESGHCLLQNGFAHLRESEFNFRNLRDSQTPYISTWDRFYPNQMRDHYPGKVLESMRPARFKRLSAGLRWWYSERFPPSPYSRFYAAFRPIETFRKIIRNNTKSFRRTIGVHLRRTDNPQQQNSPTELFVARMKREIELHPTTDFFLATDDPADEALLAQEFPGRIRIYPKRSLDRGKKESIEDALIDLYCLAETDKIIGTVYSSFSVIAARINRIPLEILEMQDSKQAY